MNDALERLKSRNRPKVSPRDATLTSAPPDIQTPGSPDIQTSRHTDHEYEQEWPEAPESNVVVTEAPERQDISESRHTDIKTSKPQDVEMQTKRSTFRMEADLIDRLHNFCRSQSISREVLIEAMYEYMEAHPDAMNEVLAAAGEKNEYRQQLANRKRAESMMNKFGGAS